MQSNSQNNFRLLHYLSKLNLTANTKVSPHLKEKKNSLKQAILISMTEILF